jgi:regulator-associated protein of mTOR
MTQGAESRRNQQKSVRVTFGPQTDKYIPLSNNAPTGGHQRSRTDVEQIPSEGQSNARFNNRNAPPPGQNPELWPDAAPRNGRPTSTLVRAKSEHWPRSGLDNGISKDGDDDFQLRHGWQEEYTSSEYLKILNSVSRPDHTSLVSWLNTL